MTSPRRSEVEREVDAMLAILGWARDLHPKDAAAFRKLAKRNLSAVRRARGRTVGYVILDRECDESGMDCWFEIKGGMLDEPINARMTRAMGKEAARVVLLPKRRSR